MGIEKMFATGFVHRQAGNICDMFVDPFTRLDVVTLPEEMPLVESAQFIGEIKQLGKFPLGYLLVNQCTPQLPLPCPLPKKLPSDIKECLEDYEIRIKREKAAIDGIKDLPLILKQIPRFTTEAIKETIENMADQLEK
jgi:hypothetical protein